MKEYLPLIKTKKRVILDTDIGPDCDDAGALSILYYFAEKADFEVAATINCTSNIYGNGALAVINGYFGYSVVEIGQYPGKGFLDGAETLKFNKYLSENFITDDDKFDLYDSLELYKKVLDESEDDGLVLITIGQFNTVAEALREYPELFNRKIKTVISMAGTFLKGREFNIFSDSASAKYFFDNFKGDIICSGFEVGEKVIAGFKDDFCVERNPVKKAYQLYNEGVLKRNSWDLTAVHYACTADERFYERSEPGIMKIDKDGNNEFIFDKDGNCSFLIKKTDDEALAEELEEYLPQ